MDLAGGSEFFILLKGRASNGLRSKANLDNTGIMYEKSDTSLFTVTHDLILLYMFFINLKNFPLTPFLISLCHSPTLHTISKPYYNPQINNKASFFQIDKSIIHFKTNI